MLLLRLIDEAIERGAAWMTLEVRESNAVAQQLYRKYGFTTVTMRAGYYSDDNESALIMWAGSLKSELYRNRLRALRARLAGLMTASFAQLARRVRSASGPAAPLRAQRPRRALRRSARAAPRREPGQSAARRTAPRSRAALLAASGSWRECEARGLPIDAAERAHPMLLHARLGAAIAREQFGVDDAEVLSAIEKHTTGAGEMSPLDCVVYLADSLEPGRSFAERAALWELARNDLDAAMRCGLAVDDPPQRPQGPRHRSRRRLPRPRASASESRRHAGGVRASAS